VLLFSRVTLAALNHLVIGFVVGFASLAGISSLVAVQARLRERGRHALDVTKAG
jgi:hypothetical protein